MVPSTDENVRTTLYSEIVLFSSFPQINHPAWFEARMKKFRITLYSKPAVSFSNFPKNGRTAWFDPQMKTLEPQWIVKQTVPQYSTVR